jgi:hypothetical protein
MKALFFTLLFACALLLGACSTDYHVTDSAPDYITRDSLRKSVTTQAAQPILHQGRMVSAGTFLFINEPYKGWHVIDNTVTIAPRNVAFITAPGSLDGSASQGYLYLQNSVDLVVLNIADPAHPTMTKRLENVLGFPSAPHQPGGYPDWRDSTRVVIGWHDTTVIVTFQPFS